MAYSSLALPIDVGILHIPNRIVMPPMVLRKATEAGMVTQALLDHYRRFQGLGLIIVEASVVAPEGRLAREQIGIFDDSHLVGLRSLVQTIHANGSFASIQIHHAGRQTNLKNTFDLPLVAPSSDTESPAKYRELREDEIQNLIQSFAAAAGRAKAAGFDAVEVHGAHGYLGSQFLSPLANRRTDSWGGSLENRARFLREVLAACKKATGTMFPIYCRLGVADHDKEGLCLEEGIQVARWLKEDGIPLLHISSGIGNPPELAPEDSPFSHRLHLAGEVRKALGLPIIGVGDIRKPEEAVLALEGGMADLVAVGRALLVDPQWAQKALAGEGNTIIPCLNCHRCHQFINPSRCPGTKNHIKEKVPND